jgi:hypothetical protein
MCCFQAAIPFCHSEAFGFVLYALDQPKSHDEGAPEWIIRDYTRFRLALRSLASPGL